jgi:hypothetical protein
LLVRHQDQQDQDRGAGKPIENDQDPQQQARDRQRGGVWLGHQRGTPRASDIDKQ